MDIQRLRLIIDSSLAKSGADDFKKSTDAVAAGANKATDSITKMESALDANARQSRITADATQKLAVTNAQAKEAWEKSGGSMEQFTKELERMAGAQKQVTDSSMAMGRAHMQAIEMNAKLGQTFNTSGAGLGRLRMGMTALAAQLTGTNPLVDRAAATIGAMGTSTVAVLGALAAVIAGGITWAAYTEAGRKAQQQQDKLTDSLEKWYAKEREGAAGEFPKQIEAETQKIADLRRELDSFGQLGAVGEGGSKGLAWVRLFTEGAATVGAGLSGQVDMAKIFWQKLKDEIHNGAANATNEITTGFAAIHAANVKARDLVQRQQADALANLVANNHATAAERAKAREVLKTDIEELARLDRLAQSPGGGSKVDQQQRIALTEEIKRLQDALDPPKLQAAADHLIAVKDALARMQAEAKETGSDASIDNRVQAIIDDLNRLEQKFPKLTGEIEVLKGAANDAGNALRDAAADKISAEIDSAYDAQVALNQAMHDGNGTLRDLTATKRADMEIDRRRLALGHELTQEERDKIHYTYENAAALQDEADAQKREIEARKQANAKVVADQKHVYEEMQRDAATFFDDIYKRGFKSFADLFGVIRDLFVKMLAEMEARWLMRKFGGAVLGAFGVGQNGNSANPTLGAAGAGAAIGAGLVGFGVGQSMPSATTGALGGALSGAATGAMIGSAVPVLGPAVGAVVGAVAGLVGGLFGHAAKVREEAAKLKDARATFEKQMDQFVYGLGQHTDLQKNLHDLSTQMQDLRDKAKELKLGTADLAAAEAAATEAGARMKKDFVDSINAQIRGATGRGYMNDALDAQKQYQSNLKDIVVAGGDASKATELFVDQLDNLAKGLTASQIQDLLKFLPELTKGMDASAAERLASALQDDLTKALNAAGAAAKAAGDDLQNRFTAANGGDSSIDVLRARQSQEMMAAKSDPNNSPAYIAQLQVVQMWELAQARVQAQNAELLKTAQTQLSVQQDALNTAKQSLDATQRLTQSLTDYSKSLATGSLSPLSPLDQKASAQQALTDAFGAAMGGDQAAASNFQNLAGTFLQLSQQYNASSSGYVSDYNSVQAMLGQLASKYGAQVSKDQQLVDAAQKQVDLLTAQIAALQDQKAIQEAIRNDVVQQIQEQRDATIKKADEQLTALYKLQDQNDADLANTVDQLTTLDKMRDELIAQGKTVPDDLLQQIGKLETIKAEQQLARDAIRDQITAVNKVKDDANAASKAQIDAVNAGADLNTQGQLALAAILVDQELAAAEQNQKVIDAIFALIDALKNPVTTGDGGGGTGGNGGTGNGGTGTGDGGNGNGDGTDGGTGGRETKGLNDVVNALTGIRLDARTTGTALEKRLGNLEDAFAELVQIGRFASRDS